MPAPHAPEFRWCAVELARQGDRSVAGLAKQLQISESCLRRWMAQADIGANGSYCTLTSVRKAGLPCRRRVFSRN